MTHHYGSSLSIQWAYCYDCNIGLPLESNPELLNDAGRRWGLPVGYHFEEVLGLDPMLLGMVLAPAVAVVLLFPCTHVTRHCRPLYSPSPHPLLLTSSLYTSPCACLCVTFHIYCARMPPTFPSSPSPFPQTHYPPPLSVCRDALHILLMMHGRVATFDAHPHPIPSHPIPSQALKRYTRTG